jgi:hypothetical protein
LSECKTYQFAVENLSSPINVTLNLTESSELNILWPSASNCKLYNISHVNSQNGTQINEIETKNVYPILTNLEVCLRHNITIKPTNQENSKELLKLNAFGHVRINPATPSAVRSINATHEELNRTIKLKWQMPEFGSQCIKNYKISVNNKSDMIETNGSVFNYSDIDYCQTYNFTVLAVSDLGNGPASSVNISAGSKGLNI